MARADRVVKQYLRTRFTITSKAGQTWSGVLLEIDGHTLRLSEVRLINPDGTETSADGHVFLPRGDVAYMQRT
jgi:hypothetical protein